jgi:type IV secretion system protein VirB6
MDPTPNTMVFRFLLNDMLKQVMASSHTTASTIAGIVGPVGVSLFGIYLLFWFLGLMSGSVSAPLTDFWRKAMRGVVILMFATSIGIYSDWIMDFFWTVPGAIGQEIVQQGSSGVNGLDGNIATSNMLDQALDAGLKAGLASWSEMSIWDGAGAIGYAVMALAIWIFCSLVCAYAAVILIIANIGLAIMLGLGPLFIVLAMFESTQAFFTAWVKQLCTFAILFLILSSIITMLFAVFTPFVTAIGQMDAGELIIAFVKVLIICFVLLMVLHQAQGWAAGLAGGVSIAAAGAIGAAVSQGARPLMHQQYDPNKKNRDGTTGGTTVRGAIPSAVNRARNAARARSNSVREG